MPVDLPESLLRQLDPARVRWYAVQTGWKPVATAVKRPVIVLNHRTDDLTQLQIPTAGSDRERAYLMGEAVRQLAEAEHRSEWDVIHDLTALHADILRLQVESRDVDAGTIPVDEGMRLFQGGCDMLLAAACSTHQRQAYHVRQTFASAQDFMSKCRFGQTEQGSFVATILGPIIPDAGIESAPLFDGAETGDWQQEPYERRVTLLLMQALQTVRGALDDGKPEAVLQGVEQGVSANLCEALAAMNPSDPRATVNVCVSWSRSRPRVPNRIPRRVSFAQFELPTVRDVGRRLREGIEPRRERIEGPILSLRAEPAQLYESFRGHVVIRALIAGRASRVQFELGKVDFARACEALRDHRTVAVSGILKRDPTAKSFDLLHPQDFQVTGIISTPPDPNADP